jgi:hypothetical protein
VAYSLVRFSGSESDFEFGLVFGFLFLLCKGFFKRRSMYSESRSNSVEDDEFEVDVDDDEFDESRQV